MDVITTHINTDFDALASMVAASKLYPSAVMVLPGGSDENVRDFLTLHEDLLDVRAVREIDLSRVSRLIVVDCQSRSRLGDLAELVDVPGLEVIVYDHHPPDHSDLPARQRVYRPTGANVTLLLQDIQARGLDLTPSEATVMALGIYEDTGNLIYSATTAEDLRAVAFLLDRGASLDLVAQFVHPQLSEEQRHALAALVEGTEHLEVHGVGVSVACLDTPEYRGELASLAHRLAHVLNAESVFLVARIARAREGNEGDVLVVGRTSGNQIDVGEVMRGLGGGGHMRAGSATLKDLSLSRAREALIEVLRREIRPELKAADIMSRPARTVEAETPVEEVARLLQRYGHSGLSVVEDGRLVGVITRRDVDKARHHQLTHAPAKGFMSRPPVTAAEETPLSELMHLMLDHSVGRLPILRGEELVGVVTRGDLLRALHGGAYAEPPTLLAERMEESLPDRVNRLLRGIAEEAEDSGAHAYLVGGIVRDLLLGIPNLDLDIVVEGDAVTLARRLGEPLKAEVRTHDRFGTAKLILPDGFRIDIATARCESYARPAALPEVEASSLQDDLRRRDFTMNAMAISLSLKRYGELIDPFGGAEDLRKKRVRVLHNLSFVDDPTRIVRAARFAGRYGFRLDPQTRRLATEAVSRGSLAALTPERLRREILHCLQEERLGEVFTQLDALGVLRVLHPELGFPTGAGGAPSRLLEAREALTWFARLRQRDKPDRPTVLLAGLLAPLGPEAAGEVCEVRLRYPPPRTAVLVEGLRQAPVLAQEAPDLAGSALARRLRGVETDVLVITAALEGRPEVLQALETYITRLRHARLSIGGSDLQALGYPPSPAFGRVLAETLDEKLDGRLRTKKSELAYAEERLRRIAEGNRCS